ncbi:MAG TPA: glycosyltransferase, partial [Chitinophagaceae bacterium]|nr:glycosyltransferase [Chitinophagaceae bacterium]
MGPAKKLLILSPPFSSAGGVSSYVLSLKGNWSVPEKYFFRGNTGANPLTRALLMIKEYISFCFTCLLSPGYKTVLVNTSMGRKALTRDNIFIWIAFLLGKKITVFIHGWDQPFFDACPRWRLSGLFRAQKLFVLSDDFKQALRRRGYTNDILVETTVVADDFIRCFDESGPGEKSGPHLLYLARLEPEKGIMTLLEAFRGLSARYPSVHLNIAGFGSLENEVKAFIADRGLQNITYH